MTKKDKKRYDLICNIIIVLLSLVAVFWLFFFGENSELSTSSVAIFKYFTVDSNILLGISSFLVLLYRLDKRKYELEDNLYKIRFMSISSVVITFLTVIFVLLPAGFGVKAMFLGPNLIMHIINPILALIVFLLFEHNKTIGKKVSLCSLIFPLVYTVIILILVGMKKIASPYPFLDIINNGIPKTFITISIMAVSIIFINFIIKLINDLLNK